MSLVFEPTPPVLAAVADGRRFPVRRVFCVGRNYAAHAREMGRDPDREPPFFFTKWAETVVPHDSVVPYPQATSDFHYEAELVVAIGKPGRAIAREAALDHVFGYAAGLDMTRRDLQLKARDQGRPWDFGKNVEASSPLGVLHPVAHAGHPERGRIRLTVGPDVRQDPDLAELIWPVPDVIAILSGFYHLEPGDLIYTGTPAGVGPLLPGDRVSGGIAGVGQFELSVAAPAI